MKFKCTSIAISIFFMTFFLVGCGSSGGGGSDTDEAGKITVTATPENILTGGTSTISARVTDASGNPVDWELVSFSVDIGSFSSGGTSANGSDYTDDTGIATLRYYAPDNAGTATVTANTSDSTADPIKINIVPKEITVTATPENISTGGTSTISAKVTDKNGNPVDYELVTFAVDIGSFSSWKTSASDSDRTNDTGIATVTYYAPDNTGIATVTANTSDSTADPIKINIVSKEITVTATPENISTGGTSTISARLTDASGNPVSYELVTFTLDIVFGSFSSRKISATDSNHTDYTGIATVTYYAPDNAGTATVTAKAFGSTSGNSIIEIYAEDVHSITVNSGSSSIVANGTSNTAIMANVRDANGNNVEDGTEVTFTTTAGDIDNPDDVITDTQVSVTTKTTNGVATAILTSPTNLGTATITATVGGVSDSTSVNFIPGAVDTINLTASPNNLTADGVSTSTIRAVVIDANDNPVGGETISFLVTTGTGTLSDATAITNSSGIATVTYTSSETAGTETINAASTNETTDDVDIELVTASIGSVSISAGAESIKADGVSQTVISATVLDVNGDNVVNGTNVTFTTTAGDIDNINAGTQSTVTAPTANGVATATLTSSVIAGPATIRATAGGIYEDTIVNFSPIPSILSLSLSQISVKSDNSDSSTITASVLDINNVPIEGVRVTFSSTGGQISASSVFTDANGEARIIFKSGTVEKKNQTVNITASVADLDPKMIPVQITGTTVSLFTNNTNLEIDPNNPDKAKTSLIISVKDAKSLPVFDAPVTITVVEPESTATAILVLPNGDTNDNTLTGNTNVNGTLTVEVTGTGVGDLKIAVEALGYTATQTYVVGAIGEIFSIIEPLEDIIRISTGTTLKITVKAPDLGSDYDNVTFATTFGTWDDGTDTVVTKLRDAENKVSAELNSADAGFATVQVYYTDEDGHLTKDSLTVAISAPSSEAAKIALQASATVVAPRTGDTSNTVTLRAKVRNANDQVVGGAPVAFLIENPTGGGETISPAVVFTNEYGIAETTFISGSLSSDAQGVTLKASVVGMPAIEPASISIIIGGTASSVVIGQSSEIKSVNEDTVYQLPMSVLVVDSNGNPVSNSQVTLGAWPKRYATGYWIEIEEDVCMPSGNRAEILNEDTNRNSIKDPGEDANDDGELTPSHSAAGSVPSIVITDDNGVAQFDLIYLKSSAGWIEDSITASTVVYGTETQSTYTFWLPWMEKESCNLSDSPYNTISDSEPSILSLSLSQISVKSDNSDSSTITATVLDASYAVMEGITVVFSAEGGQISASSADTDATGRAQITFSSGTSDPSNQVVTITGTVSELSSQIPVQIVGSALTLSTDNSNITDDGSTTATLTITAKDAGGKPVYDIPVTLSVSGIGGGGVDLSAYTGKTDSSGKLQVTVTGTGAGSVTVTADGLKTTGTQAYTVSSVGALFGIILPATDPYLLSTNTPLSITVNASGLTNVQFATTLGTLTGTIDGKTGQVIEESVDPVSETASAEFLSSQAGLATIQVFNPDNPSTSDTLGVAITAPSGDAAHITLQSNTYVLAPSSGGISNTATLTATVRTSDLQVVGGAPVAFSIENPTGGGETILPVVVYTDEAGVASTTFTSGSLPSVEPVIVNARVVGDTTVDVAIDPGITIGGTAGSVVIGIGTEITVLNETTYALPMSVLVADSNGNSVSGAVVSLSAWPDQYSAGAWYDEDPDPQGKKFVPYISGTFDNEDLNENTFLEPGEDTNGDGLLTPHNSASGTLSASVTTDENGVANFDLVYLKAHATWIRDRIRASTFALGTETTASTTFRLPYARSEGEAGVLNDSPYPIGLTVGIGGTTSYTFPVFTGLKDDFTPIYGTVIAYTYTFPDPINPPPSAGDVITDWITIIGNVKDPVTGAESSIGTIVPVQIIVK